MMWKPRALVQWLPHPFESHSTVQYTVSRIITKAGERQKTLDYCIFVIHIDHSTAIFMHKYRAVSSIQGVCQSCSYCMLLGAFSLKVVEKSDCQACYVCLSAWNSATPNNRTLLKFNICDFLKICW
jgi:hypothetical protein